MFRCLAEAGKFVFFACLAALAASRGPLAFAEAGKDPADIYAFHAVSDALSTSGMLHEGDVDVLRENGFETIIDLRIVDKGDTEAEEVQATGMRYINVPTKWRKPQPESIEEFFAAMDANKDKKVLVHCGANLRASAMVFLYRVIKQNTPYDIALRDLHEVWEPDKIWQAFIDEAIDRYSK